jgi:NADH:ubiquinone reductase (H+-translocating)
MARQQRVVILGAGFAGLAVAQRLARAPVEVLIADRRNYHLFQPLLYQVATAALSPAEIASPIRHALRKQKNATVVLDEALAIDTAKRVVHFENKVDVDYDVLVVATGATHSYFGKPEWAALAPGLKTVEDATEIRKRFLLAFEAAELEADEASRRQALTFVIVGGGPTGVELAGAMAEIARKAIPQDFRNIDTTTARVLLLQGGARVLPAFPEAASVKAAKQLEALGVEIRCNCRVTGIDADGVMVGTERIAANTVLWAAGVQGSPLGATLGATLDKSGRVPVGPDLALIDHPEVFVVGDLAAVTDINGVAVPGVAPAALQMGQFVGQLLAAETMARAQGDAPPARPAFLYRDKGSLAVIGRNRAVAAFGSRTFGGFIAWVLWAFVHVLFLVSFRNRLAVAFQWTWSYLFFDRGARLITGAGDVKLHKPWMPAALERAPPPPPAPPA